SPARDTWSTSYTKDPFRVPVARKLDLLFEVNKAARAQSVPVAAVRGQMHCVSEEKLFFSSEGAEIDQTLVRVAPGFGVTVADGGDFEHRSLHAAPRAAGFEYVEGLHMAEGAPRVAVAAFCKM